MLGLPALAAALEGHYVGDVELKLVVEGQSQALGATFAQSRQHLVCHVAVIVQPHHFVFGLFMRQIEYQLPQHALFLQ